MKKSAPPNYLFMSLVTLLARDFQILRFYGNRGYTNTTLRLNCSWDGVSSHLFSCLFRRRRCLLIQKKKGNPKLQYSSQNQLDEVSHWYPYPRQATKFVNFVTLFQKDGNFIYQNLFDPVQPFFAFFSVFWQLLLPYRGLVQHFVLLAERLEQDSDTRPLHYSDLYLDEHYYMLFAENSKICLNSESQQRGELRMERNSQIRGKEIIQKILSPLNQTL